MKKCPKCQAENLDTAKSCNECGEAFVLEYRCSKCNMLYKRCVKFCNECGGKVIGITAKTNKVTESEDDKFVLVEGGTLDLGSDDDDDDDNPVHEVTLDSFYISKYQVTQKLYQSVMGKNPSDFKGENRPVECVSWYDAVEFCNKLSRKEGLEPCYTIDKRNEDPNNESEFDAVKWTVECDFTKNGYRLPTEAEWEYAARGGQETGSYKYAGSDDLDSVGWYYDNANYETHNVGKKEPNELGIYDMSGNVWEWCWDWYDEEVESGYAPMGASSGPFRVLRGGSWYDFAYYSSVGRRYDFNPYYGDSYLGFRVCRSAQ